MPHRALVFRFSLHRPMTDSRWIAALVLAVCVLALRPGVALATGARSQALLGSWAFEDSDDVSIFPALAPLYANGVYFDALDWSNADSATQNHIGGGVLLGKPWTLGIWINRPALADRSTLFGVQAIPLVSILQSGAQWIPAGDIADVTLARKIDDAHSWGLAVRGTYYKGASPEMTDPSFPSSFQGNVAGATTPWRAYGGLTFTGGYHAPNLDLAAQALWLHHTSDRNGQSRGDSMAFGFAVRYFKPLAYGWTLVVASQPTLFGYLSKDPEDGDAPSAYGATLPVEVGAKLSLLDSRLSVAMMGGLALQMAQVFPKEDGVDGQLAEGLSGPSVRAVAEYRVLSWLTLRAGIQHAWGIWFAGNEEDKLPAGPGFAVTTERTDVRFGMGVTYRNFGLDAVVRYAFLRDGPDLLGGTGPGLFGGLSLFIRD